MRGGPGEEDGDIENGGGAACGWCTCVWLWWKTEREVIAVGRNMRRVAII